MQQKEDIQGFRVVPGLYNGDNNAINLAGCYSFSVRNTGTVKAFLFGSMPLEPGEYVSFPNIDGKPYINDANLEFVKTDAPDAVREVLVVKSTAYDSSHQEKGLI